MTGVIFRETLRRSWKTMLLLGVGLAAMAAYMVLIFGDSELLKQFSGVIQNMGFLVKTLGGGDAAFLATAAGMLNYGYFNWIVLLLAAYGVIAGLSITAGEEDRGILDILLSQPVPRWRVVVEKFLAYTIVLIGADAIGFVTLAVTAGNNPEIKVSVARLLEGSINMLPPLLLVMAFTALVAVLVRRRNVAATVAAIFVIGSYFIEMIGRNAQAMEGLRSISFFTYFDSFGVMKNGLIWANVIGLLVVAVLLFIGVLWAFQRRDVGV